MDASKKAEKGVKGLKQGKNTFLKANHPNETRTVRRSANGSNVTSR